MLAGHLCGGYSSGTTKPFWVIEAEPEDVGSYCWVEDEGTERAVGHPRFRLCYTVKIPRCDWSTVVWRLQGHTLNRWRRYVGHDMQRTLADRDQFFLVRITWIP
jgi:hypothetical protein